MRAIDATDIERLLGPDWMRTPLPDKISLNVAADLLRMALLDRFGGVWADATTFPVQPLDTWIDQHSITGFFAFDKPGPGRPLSNWFLAAMPANELMRKWQDRSWDYWYQRDEMDDYHWHHNEFAKLLETDQKAADRYAEIDTISAAHVLHFGPKNPTFDLPVSDTVMAAVANRIAPVCKLTHKHPLGPEGTTMNWLSTVLSSRSDDPV